LKLADVFLDTYPYNCGSTSNDVINAGIELVTMSGRTLVSRMGLSLLMAQKKSISIIESFKSYETKIIKICKRGVGNLENTKKTPFLIDGESLSRFK
jgi:predicted O-linked N-acetylglucosamine transferase (SPINDLY family)